MNSKRFLSRLNFRTKVYVKKNDLKRLIEIKEGRLQALQEKEALKGIDVEPQIKLEIESLKKELGEMKAQLPQMLDPHAKTQADLRKMLTIKVSPVFPRVSSSLIDKLRCCAVARFLNEELVGKLTGNKAFWQRLSNTSLLVDIEIASQQRTCLEPDVRTELLNSLYTQSPRKYKQLHIMLENHYDELFSKKSESMWIYKSELLYHQWSRANDNDEIVERALNEAIRWSDTEGFSFEHVAQILWDIARERPDRQDLNRGVRILQQGVAIQEQRDWYEVLDFCDRLSDDKDIYWDRLYDSSRAWVWYWRGLARLNIYEEDIIDAIKDFARILCVEPGYRDARKHLCLAHEELENQNTPESSQ